MRYSQRKNRVWMKGRGGLNKKKAVIILPHVFEMSSSPWASKKAWVDDETMSPKFPLLLPEHFFEISKHLTCAYELGSMLLTCKEWHNGIMIAMSNINPYWIQRDFTGFKEKTTYIETLKNLCQLLFECIL